jgi:hypothetical protein
MHIDFDHGFTFGGHSMRFRPIARLVLSAVFLAFALNGLAHANPQDAPTPARVEDAPGLSPEQLEILEPEVLRDLAERSLRDSLDDAGLPADGTLFVLTLRQAYELALIQARSPKPVWTGAEAKSYNAEALKNVGEAFGVSDFKRFRADFLATDEDPKKTGGFRDPSATFLKALTLRAEVGTNGEALWMYESLHRAFTQFAAGVSDISRQNLNQVELSIQRQRRLQIQALLRYRNTLDDLKQELGLPLDVPVIPDDSDLAAFRETFRKFGDWWSDGERDPDEWPGRLEGLPAFPDIRSGDLALDDIARDSSKLPSLLQAAGRLASHSSKTPARSAKLVRRCARSLLHARDVFSIEQKLYLFHVQNKDIAIRSLFSPPRPMHAAEDTTRHTADLMNSLSAASTQQQRLVSLWTSYQVDRMALARLLHQMPGEDWDSFLNLFTAKARPGEAPKPDGAK